MKKERPTLDDIELSLLLEAIFLQYHHDFRGYSRASLKRHGRSERRWLCRFEVAERRARSNPVPAYGP